MAQPRIGTWLTCVALSGTVIAIPGVTAAAEPMFRLTDPAGDDRGPGHYVHPSGKRFRQGGFDLRRFEVISRDDHAELRITVDRPPVKPIEARISDAQTLDLSNNIYVQNIDVYIDMTPGIGQIEGLPGRRIAFHAQQGWELAVALTPQPYGVRAVMEGWGLPGTQVYTPADVSHDGPTFVARVPYDRLGGPPEPTWGWAVTVAGATWGQSFAIADRIADRHRLDAYTLPVHTVAQDDAFGGGTVGGLHPQVVDILTPAGVSQQRLLSSHDTAAKRFATVPMVYPDPKAADAAGHLTAPELIGPAARDAEAPAPRPRIRDVLETTVVIVDPPAGLSPYRLVEVLGDDGQPVGKLVITAIRSEFVTATVVEGLGAIRDGMAIRLPPRAPAPADSQE